MTLLILCARWTCSIRKKIIYENEKKFLCLHVVRVIYGCIESYFLWYKLYYKTLNKKGFTISPYDICVVNKMVNGKQSKLGWYVYYNKLSHVDTKVVDGILEILKRHFGYLTIHWGKKFTLLGVNITITDGNEIKV